MEIGDRRSPRQPGQVRKEAATTSSVRVVVQSLFLFYQDNCHKILILEKLP